MGGWFGRGTRALSGKIVDHAVGVKQRPAHADHARDDWRLKEEEEPQFETPDHPSENRCPYRDSASTGPLWPRHRQKQVPRAYICEYEFTELRSAFAGRASASGRTGLLLRTLNQPGKFL